MFRPIRLVLCLLAAYVTCFAAVTGSLSGVVRDPAGRLVPGARLTANNAAQNRAFPAVTDNEGVYRFATLPVGNYVLKVEAAGFRPVRDSGIQIDVDAAVSVNFSLSVAARTDEIIVTESALAVEATSSQNGEVVVAEQMAQVALNGRSFTDLLALQPGIVPMSTQTTDSVVMAGATVAISPSGALNPGNQSINGQREDANGFRINDGDVKELMNGGTLIVPNLDSIAEFRVLTSNFDAQYGDYSGGIVNVVTKSGTKSVHGTAFEFLRNTQLDARNFFSGDRSFYRQNQFGGAVGGPIGKGKVFYFGDYQGTRTKQGIDTGRIAVPSLSERSGDFSAVADQLTGSVAGPYLAGLLSSSLGHTVTSGEPYYTVGCTTSAQCVFPGAVIPQRVWSIPAKNLLRYIPLPNTGTGSFSSSSDAATTRDDKGSFRIDSNGGRWGDFSAYYFLDDYRVDNPYPTGQGGASVPGFNALNLGRGQLASLSNTKSFGSSAVNEFHLSYMRSANNVGEPSGGVGPSLASQGFVTGIGTYGIVPLAPAIEGVENVVFNSFVMGTPITNLRQANNTYAIRDTFSRAFDKHIMKAGIEASYEQVNVNPNPTFNGSFLFSGSETGSDFADFLIGVASNYNQADSQAYYLRHRYASAFAQDSWRAAPGLTINYGIRWDRMQYWSEKYNQIPTFMPGQQSEVFAGAPVGLVYPGDTGVPSTLVPSSNRFSPRIGLAWSPEISGGLFRRIAGERGKTNIRAGYGIYYNVIQGNVMAFDEPQPPYGLSYTSPGEPLFASPFRTAADGSFGGNPFPLKFPSLNTSISNPDSSVDFAQFEPIAGMTAPVPWNTYPYTESYSASIERRIGSNATISLGYAGSQSHHLLLVYSANPGNPALCIALSAVSAVAPGSATCGPFGEDQAYTTATGQSVTGTRTGLGPAFSNDDYNASIGNANFNSFQTSMRHVTKATSVSVTYTFSKSIDQASSLSDPVDPFNFGRTRAVSAFDLKHDLVATGDFRFPSRFQARGLNSLARDWALSGVVRMTSGFPVTLRSTGDNSLMGSIPNGVNNYSLDLPDYAGGALQLNGDPRNGSPYFNAAAFSENALGTPGNASRRPFYGPGSLNFDLALLRDIRMGEGKALQFRLEAFNAFNHAQFFGPAAVSGNIDSSLFGQVVKAAPPRLMQIAVKFTY
jgi:hypothetical protein